uniref:Mevalonate kinase n=1 Tax=Globodera rostochiensis TaxID=31243 RepID=A0A914HUH2_GLORO
MNASPRPFISHRRAATVETLWRSVGIGTKPVQSTAKVPSVAEEPLKERHTTPRGKRKEMVWPTTAGGQNAAHQNHNHHQQDSVSAHAIGVPGVSTTSSPVSVVPPPASVPVRDKFAAFPPRVAILTSNHSSATADHSAATASHNSSAQNSPSASSNASGCSAVPTPPHVIHKQYQQHHHHLPPTGSPPIVAVQLFPAGSAAAAAAAAAASLPPQSSPMRSLSSASGGLYVSAPGKIILFGEHAVVYGRTAIAGSIDLRTYLSLFTSADGRIYLSLPDMNIERTWMLKELQREIAKVPADPALLAEEPPSLELVVPIARKLSGACEDQCGVQNLAILAFWYLLIGVLLRKRALDMETEQQHERSVTPRGDSTTSAGAASPPPSPSAAQPPQSQSRLASSPIGPCPLLDAKRKDLLAVKVTVRFKLPSCVGLGSSGAYCVCIATALLQTAGLIPPPTVCADSDELTWDESVLDTIRKWSSAAESLIHGRASGLDAAICTYGGIASYTPGKRIENLQNSPELLKVVLINSRVERNTSRLVQTVKDNYRKYPAVFKPIDWPCPDCRLIKPNAFDAHLISKFPLILDTIDALAYEAAKILQRQPFLLGGENGSMILENGGRTTESGGGGTLTPHAAYAPDRPGASTEQQHNNLQPIASSLAGRSSSLGGGSSYFAGGKRDSNASAVSGVSTGTGRAERNELTETFDRLNELCRMNNQLLITLGVGHAKVDQICTMLGRYGIHPKMTGAGGGGCLFAFLKPDTSQTILNMIRDELRKEGYEMWQPTLGGPGVLQHHHKPEIFTSGSASSSTSSTGRGSSSSMALPGGAGGGGGSGSTRSNTPASSHQTTPAARHKK